MEIFILCAVIGIAIVVLILKFDKKQTVKVKTVLKESRSVPPLFMLKSTEQKIGVLKAALHYDDAPKNMASAASMTDINSDKNESNRLTKVQELKVLSARYNNGMMSLDAYNLKLDELLDYVQSNSASFELAS